MCPNLFLQPGMRGTIIYILGGGQTSFTRPARYYLGIWTDSFFRIGGPLCRYHFTTYPR
uniref:Uncharacterized protein n=1 Tax=Picea glauca TaxID=3330 RepID=A0A124GP24_PICGL|nr:hypothetical protein ABT39_MTgene490 [Picea glauca]